MSDETGNFIYLYVLYLVLTPSYYEILCTDVYHYGDNRRAVYKRIVQVIGYALRTTRRRFSGRTQQVAGVCVPGGPAVASSTTFPERQLSRTTG